MHNPQQKNVLICFCDLSNFGRISRKHSDAEVFACLSAVYEMIGEIVEAAKGRVIKFIGDAALVIFEEEDIDNGIRALKQLKTEVDAFNAKAGYDSRLIIKAHFDSVMAGMLGTKNNQRYDIIGNAVNIAAALKSNGLAISVEAFRKLSKDTRQLFKKHTPPVTYIDVAERHKD